MMRIGIIGAGAMGQLFGARLKAAGNNVVLVDVSQNTIDMLNSKGVTIRTASSEVHVPVSASFATNVQDTIDLVIVFTKGFHTKTAVASVKHLFHEETLGLTLQNGVGNEQVLLKELGQERTLAGMTDFPADRLGCGIIVSADYGHVVLGDAVPAERVSPAATAVAGILDSAGLNTVTHPDVRIPVWEKLIFNTVMNTIGGATGITVGETGHVDSARKLAEQIFTEAIAVATACGIEVSEENIRNSLRNAFESHADHKTSMTADVEAGFPTEIETIGGAVEAAGKEQGIETPVLSVLCDVVRLRTLPRN